MRFIKHFSFFAILLVSIFINAQEVPPVNNFTTNDYGAENQNWAISQSESKNIYVANNSGLLEYNGAKWKLYNSPNNSVIRYVTVLDDKVYTGGYMEFGFWQKNEFGVLIYQSLSDIIKDDLIEEDFWNIIKSDTFILFQSLQRIYIYDTEKETFKIINSKVSLPKLFKVDESIYFQKIGEGIFKIENGEEVLISDHQILKDNILVNVYLIDESLSFQTQDLGIFQYKNNELKKWNISANKFLESISVYSSIQLRDGSFVIGTISNGMLHLDTEGNLVTTINQEKGLNNNTVLSIYEDLDNNIWLGLDNGISVVNLKTPLNIYYDLNGELGSVYASATLDGKLYLGTNQGLFYKNLNSNDEFKLIENTNGQVWCLKVFDNTLFCGHNTGTFVVEGENARLIAKVMGTWDLKPLKGTKMLLQGNYNGLSILEKKGGRWQFRNTLNGFTISSRFFEMINENQVFVNHESNGLLVLNINEEYTKVLDYVVDESAPKSLKSGLTKYNGELVYMASSGLYKYDTSRTEFVKDDFLSEILLSNNGYISGKLIGIKESKSLWAFTKEDIIYFSPGKIDSSLKEHNIPLPASLRSFLPGFESMTHLKDELYLFGTTRGYIQLDLDQLKYEDFDISINSIEKSVLNNSKTHIPLTVNSSFKSFENNLYFEFSVPEYQKYFEVKYQYQLEGMYNEWSDWSTKPNASFENLPFGDYTFNVKAKIGVKTSNNTASYSFSIDRPWYISNSMIVIYILLLIATIVITHSIYKRNFNKQKKLLLLKKQRELAFSQLESEKVIMKLKNEKLQDEIESKTRELSASTMSIIKKNEILNTIKDELAAVKEDSKVKPVIKIINKNLTNTGDWEMFQEAFNNADSDFLKKVKNIHPKLTPNDLRLCAYLRLNLSSKEIAPLLNISPRSVEIKRYRLRKKMELAHEKSLVEYILEL